MASQHSMSAATRAEMMSPGKVEVQVGHDETDVTADETAPRQIAGTIYEFGTAQDSQTDRQFQPGLQSGEYFSMLRDKNSQGDAEQEACTSSADGDDASHHLSDEDSVDALSAGGTSEEEGLFRVHLPSARQTPQHEISGTVRTADDLGDAWPSKGGVPCVPFVNLRQKSQRKKSSAAKPSSAPPATVDPERAKAMKDEEMWLARKQLTGVVARMVSYAPGEKPADDVLSLQRTPNGDLMVVSLCPDGPASMAGIVRGDKLVSINGQKTPAQAREDVILTGLRGPMTLVFLGFVGKIQAEVQVAQPDAPSCGFF
mmetsp:Transcript_44779/g.103594  ORF Transcript_44779/g.103594 Transcript_44779/m.103594 type:complete len:314 (+) Transcript_44779:118-1059(+)